MRKIIIVTFFGIFFYLVYSFVFKNSSTINLLSSPSPSPTPQDVGSVKGVSFANDNFNYYFVDANPINLHLISNLEDKLTAKEARIKSNCEYLINAGFYTKEEKQIGLFISDFKKVSSATNSNLFNGFFTVDANNNASIVNSAPDFNARIALQSGPILIFNTTVQVLEPTNDEMARRVVLEKDTTGNLVFVVIFKKDNYAVGPYLKNLPQVLSLINKNLGKNVDSAINLDGGAHSAFITNDVSINEISTIGSYFCIR